MKKVLFTDKQLQVIKEGIEKEESLSNKLRPFIFKQVKKHMTSLGNNDAFPPEEDFPFDYKVLKDRFSEVIENIKNIENLESYDETYLSNRLSKLVKECKEIEEPIKPNLEKICTNVILSLFDVPNDTLNFEAKIVDEITPEHQFRIKPEPSAKRKFDFESLDDFKDANKAVLKRRMINSLIQGASYHYATDKSLFLSDIYTIDKRLIPIYEEIIAINDYLLFTKEEKITDKTPMQGGCVEVMLGANKDKTTIVAQGIIFPFALTELIRGFFELFASHGLPEDNTKARYIINQADFLIAEPWDLRMGVNLWRYIIPSFNDTKILPYFFSDLCSLTVEDFNMVLRETFAQTEKGKHLMKHLALNAEDDMQSQGFISTIDAKNAQISIIADGTIGEDELTEMIKESQSLHENEEDEAIYNLPDDERGDKVFDYQVDQDWADIDRKEDKEIEALRKFLKKKNGDDLADKIAKSDKTQQGGMVSASEKKWAPTYDYSDLQQRIRDLNGGKSMYSREDLMRLLDLDTDKWNGKTSHKPTKVQTSIETDFDATQIGKLFSHGNGKLSADILLINLTTAKNCPSDKLGLCAVSDICYAKKAEHMYKDYAKQNIRNEIVIPLMKPKEFIARIEEAIEKFGYKTNFIRFNEAGDFTSQISVDICEQIAKYFYQNYGIQTSAYTCRTDLDFSRCKYMIVNGSNKHIKGCDRFYIACSDKFFNKLEPCNGQQANIDKNGQKYYKCDCNCKQCHFCYQTRGQNGEDEGNPTIVYCRKH